MDTPGCCVDRASMPMSTPSRSTSLICPLVEPSFDADSSIPTWYPQLKMFSTTSQSARWKMNEVALASVKSMTLLSCDQNGQKWTSWIRPMSVHRSTQIPLRRGCP